MKKFYITEKERRLITSTPPKECWICNLFSNNIHYNNVGFFIPENILNDAGIIEHLYQIIKRKITVD